MIIKFNSNNYICVPHDSLNLEWTLPVAIYLRIIVLLQSKEDEVDNSPRPLSEISEMSVEVGGTLGKKRIKPISDKQRPLTRYLPIRGSDLDLRNHIETAGNVLFRQQNPLIWFNWSVNYAPSFWNTQCRKVDYSFFVDFRPSGGFVSTRDHQFQHMPRIFTQKRFQTEWMVTKMVCLWPQQAHFNLLHR